MRIIDREARIDKLRRGSVVTEARYSGDPGGITTHSSLISCKAAWNPMLSALINVLSASLSLLLPLSDSSPLSLSLSLCFLGLMNAERINKSIPLLDT